MKCHAEKIVFFLLDPPGRCPACRDRSSLLFCQKDTENLRAGPAGSQVQAAAPEAAPTGTQVEEPEEMCAVWVPFMSLDMSTEADKSEKAFQKKFDAIVQGAKSKGMNTLIVHVRPFGDALYPSSLYPGPTCSPGRRGRIRDTILWRIWCRLPMKLDCSSMPG